MLCIVHISSAQDCKKAEEMIRKAVIKQPDLKTEDNIRAALSQCPDEPSLYSQAGDYYSHWYNTESNATFRLEYKQLAIEFYRQGAKHAEGSTADQMKLKATNLESKRKWSKATFRGLTPV